MAIEDDRDGIEVTSPTRHLDDLQRVLAKIMRVILVGALVAVLVLGAMMLRAAWSGHQGEVYYVAAGMLFITVMIVERLVKLRGR